MKELGICDRLPADRRLAIRGILVRHTRGKILSRKSVRFDSGLVWQDFRKVLWEAVCGWIPS